MRTIIIALLLCSPIFAVAPLYAVQETAGCDGAAPEQPAAEKKPALGDWWNKSSLDYDPMPQQFLLHGDIEYRYQKASGNMDSFVHALLSRIDLRKRRITNSFAYTVDKNKIETTFAGRSEQNHQIVEDTIKFDLTPKIFANAGAIWETNTIALIDSRYALYGGAGYRLFTTAGHKFYALLAYGYLDEKYTGNVVRMLGFSKRNFNTGFLDQNYEWNVTESVTFNEKFRLIHSLNSTEHFVLNESGNLTSRGRKRRNIDVVSLHLDFKITDSFFLTNEYLINYDGTPWPGVKTTDTRLMSGVKFRF
jgi:hypothetical protein